MKKFITILDNEGVEYSFLKSDVSSVRYGKNETLYIRVNNSDEYHVFKYTKEDSYIEFMTELDQWVKTDVTVVENFELKNIL